MLCSGWASALHAESGARNTNQKKVLKMTTLSTSLTEEASSKKRIAPFYAPLLIGLALLASCASGGSSSNPGSSPPEATNPIEPGVSQPIEIPDDGGKDITIGDDGKVYVDGDQKGTIDGSGFVRDENGDILGVIGTDHDGTNAYWTFTPVEGGNQYYFQVENGRVVINWERSRIDIGWGVSAPPPVLPEPAMMAEPGSMSLSPDQKRRARDARSRFKSALK